MKALVTGATGKVGHGIARALLARGDQVRALVRDPVKAARTLPEGVEPIPGDVTAPHTLPPAVEGADLVFNAMGLPEQWVKDEAIFERVNAVRARGIDRSNPDTSLDLLAITFEEATAPSGTVTLIFAEGGAIQLDLECVEMQMKDLGPVWKAESRPKHEEVDQPERPPAGRL